MIEPALGLGDILDGRAAPASKEFRPGDLVTLRHISQTELRADGRSLSLRGQPQPGQPPLRLRWLSLANPEGAAGRVVATRFTLLHDIVAGMDLFGLPDPLERLPGLLNEMVSGTQSTIHGDLNLENALVGPGDFIWLIDFAMTRDGHTLFDFAHLEAEIIAQVIAPQLGSPQDYLDLLQREGESSVPQFYALLAALRQIASRSYSTPLNRAVLAGSLFDMPGCAEVC